MPGGSTLTRGKHRADTTPLGRRFRVLWLGQAVSQLGDKMAYISIPLFVAHLADNGEIELGIAYALESFPVLLLGIFGGVLIDRVPLRPVMILSDVGRAVAFFYLATVARADPVAEGSQSSALLAVFAIAFLVGGMTNIFETGLFALLPAIVGPRDLSSANGRITATMTLGDALGPPLAGLLITLQGFYTVFIVDALTFVASATSLVLLGSVRRPPSELPPSAFLTDLLQGLRYVWSEIRLRVSTIAIAVMNLVTGFVEATFVILAKEVVGVSSDFQLGLLFAMFGIGATTGAVTAPAITRVIGLGKTMVLGIGCFGTALTIFVNRPLGLLGLGYVFIAFVGLAAANVAIATIRQVYTPPVMMGRVLAATRNIAYATLPVGALLGTAVAEATGAYETMARYGPLIIVVAAIALIPTVLWTNTRGPTPGRRSRETAAAER
ncbi:MAG TPA: MFS transporter [Acidimicrobiia bacterium]